MHSSSKHVRFYRPGGSLIRKRTMYRPTNKLAKFVRNVVSSSTGVVVRYPRTDPPAFKRDRPMKRLVRVPISDTSGGLTANDVQVAEAGYYGITTARRWTNLKFLCITAYGRAATSTGNVPIRVTLAGTNQFGETTADDLGDLNHRACVKFILPPTTPVVPVQDMTTFASFTPGTLSFIDCYVEFS